MTIHDTRGKGKNALFGIGLALAAAAAIAPGCGDDTGTGTGGSGATSTTNTGGGATTATTTTTTVTTGNGGGGGGTGDPCACATTSPDETRGSAIAISADDSTLVAVNRDVGSVSVVSVDYSGSAPAMTLVDELDLGAGSEPWQVAVDACGKCAYVVLRDDQEAVRIEGLDTATPTVGPSIAVGSEPTGIALSPNGSKLYVANWVEGTVSVIDPTDMSVTSTIDLNAALIAADTANKIILGGPTASRPALAHPRSIAISNDGDTDDADETVIVTEFYAQRTLPELANGTNGDVAKSGLVYKFSSGAAPAVTTVLLPPMADNGFKDTTNNALVGTPGCYPNQVSSVTIKDGFAYVTSVCASPEGPIGVFVKNACFSDGPACPNSGVCVAGACTLTCPTTGTQAAADDVCATVTGTEATTPNSAFNAGGACNMATGACAANTTNVKTTTHPGLSVVKLSDDTATTVVMDALFDATAVSSARMPLLPSDLGFRADFAYTTAMGTDAAFRMTMNTTAGTVTTAGSTNNDFIDVRTTASATIRLPIGIAITSGVNAFAFSANDGNRDITAIDLGTQAAVGSLATAALPAASSAAERVLKGKRFFNTGLGRWSLGGAGWGACAACHIDGLSDNVTWYFGRGTRQSVSLDGTFSKVNPNTDMRILNWTAIFDEVSDFENNVRAVSGGVGALVKTLSGPPAVNTDRISFDDTTKPPPQGFLEGSSDNIAKVSGGVGTHDFTLLEDWNEMTDWVKTVRSPRAPVGLNATTVAAGRALYVANKCSGCHGGDKWTISTRFYTPSDTANPAFSASPSAGLPFKAWVIPSGFVTSLLPTCTGTPCTTVGTMRTGALAGAQQIQCILRNVGTFNVAPAAVGVSELRQDMAAVSQGAAAGGNGFNPPSLLGLQVGAPYFHAGQASTLEEAFDTVFNAHHRALASTFTPSATEVAQLTQYLLSIDGDAVADGIPVAGSLGGDFCVFP